MKLIIFLIGIVVVVVWSAWIVVNPEGYRQYLQNHPGMDQTGKWENASDAKIRTMGVILILAMLGCGFAILKLVGIL